MSLSRHKMKLHAHQLTYVYTTEPQQKVQSDELCDLKVFTSSSFPQTRVNFDITVQNKARSGRSLQCKLTRAFTVCHPQTISQHAVGETHQNWRWWISTQRNTPHSHERTMQYSGWTDVLRFGRCLILAKIFPTWWTGHKLSHVLGKQYTKICFWKHLKREIGNAVTESCFIFDQHRPVWQFNRTFVSVVLDRPHLHKVDV